MQRNIIKYAFDLWNVQSNAVWNALCWDTEPHDLHSVNWPAIPLEPRN